MYPCPHCNEVTISWFHKWWCGERNAKKCGNCNSKICSKPWLNALWGVFNYNLFAAGLFLSITEINENLGIGFMFTLFLLEYLRIMFVPLVIVKKND